MERTRRLAIVPRTVCFWLAVVVFSLFSPEIVWAAAGHRDPGEPNLLVIIADDHGGGTLGIEGDPRRATPNLDALARQGVLFERAYCNSPLCTPSRQSLITGKLPHSIGVTQLTTRLSDDALTIGEWLRNLDYRTLAIGKMHFNGPSAHGFTVRIDTPDWERTSALIRLEAATGVARGDRFSNLPSSGSTRPVDQRGYRSSRCSPRSSWTAQSSISRKNTTGPSR